MNVGSIACILLATFFMIIALLFGIGKTHVAKFISGFHELTKEARKQYDQRRMALDMRNICLQYAGIMMIGACLSAWLSEYFALLVIVVWLIIMFKRDVHVDEETAFGKYRIQHNEDTHKESE